MLYRLFIYKSTAKTAGAPAIEIVNHAIRLDSEINWKSDCADNAMMPFDASDIKYKIETALGGAQDGAAKCCITIKNSPQKRVEYLYITASYRMIKDVLPTIHAIAVENLLVLYDAEMRRSFLPTDLYDDAYVTMKIRAQDINNVIMETQQPVWHLRRLGILNGQRDKSCAYIVTLKKSPNASFEQRVSQFYDCLKNNLIAGEFLDCKYKCFTVKSSWYRITYCLEGYKKSADKMGHKKKGSPQSSPIHRMSCEAAFKWAKGCTDTELNDIKCRMHFIEMVRAYPNPADRFVRSVMITKQQRKEKFDIRYSDIGHYSSEILFHIVEDDYYEDTASISVLKIEEDCATFILPFVKDVYPYFYQRYYLTENHLPKEMWSDILDKLKNAKELILHDTFNEELKPYIEHFNLYVLISHNSDGSWDAAEYDMIKNNPVQFLYNYRYDVAHFYDMFIDWSNAQLKNYQNEDRMFNIQGP